MDLFGVVTTDAKDRKPSYLPQWKVNPVLLEHTTFQGGNGNKSKKGGQLPDRIAGALTSIRIIWKVPSGRDHRRLWSKSICFINWTYIYIGLNVILGISQFDSVLSIMIHEYINYII